MEPKKPDAPDANLARDMLAELMGIVRTPETVQREVRELEIAQARQRLRDAVQSAMYQVKFYGVGRLGMDSPGFRPSTAEDLRRIGLDPAEAAAPT